MRRSALSSFQPRMDFLAPPSPLDAFFRPKSVAVIGASETPGALGRTFLWNLISSPFGGVVVPVHPSREHVLGVQCVRTLRSINRPVDLAIIACDPGSVSLALQDCLVMGTKAVIVATAADLPAAHLEGARKTGLRILGPDSLGLLSPHGHLNASYAASPMPRAGNVAFLSQSGALCSAVLDWSARQNTGFSAFVSTGQLADVGWGDLLDHFTADAKTRSILVYLESIDEARSFLSAAREASLAKPVLAICPADDPVLDAAFQRCGVLRVERIAELFSMADVLAKQPRPRGPRLHLVTNAGGPAALAAKALPGGIDAIDDLGLAATPEALSGALAAALASPETDGVLAILTPQVNSDPLEAARQVAAQSKGSSKPVLASWMGGPAVEAGRQHLADSGIPVFNFPDTAARAFHYSWLYEDRQRALYETPTLADPLASTADAATVIASARQRQSTTLDDAELAGLFHAYGLEFHPDPPPGFEFYLGSRLDPRFGPYLIVGLGGRLGRVINDHALGLPPLTTTLARRMLEKTLLYQGLAAEGADLAALEQTIVRFGQLIAEQPAISSIDIAPLVLSTDAIYLKTARVRLHAPGKEESRLAIRPYPAQYTRSWTARNGLEFLLRPIRPEDEPLLVGFHEALSDRTVYMRYLQMLKLEQRVSHERLTRICFNDYDRELALVAETEVDGERRVVAVARLARLRQHLEQAEVAVVVADAWQGVGLGSELLRRLVDIGRQEKVKRLWADILADNSKMQRLCESLGFRIHREDLSDSVVTGFLDL